MVQCDNCNRPSAIGGVLIAADKYLENEGTILNQKWCLDCISGTREERERREEFS
jgi:hypothetical protein